MVALINHLLTYLLTYLNLGAKNKLGAAPYLTAYIVKQESLANAKVSTRQPTALHMVENGF